MSDTILVAGVARARAAACWLAAALFAGNGLFMLADPIGWWAVTPGAAESGVMNGHFVRDVGLAFIASGTAAVIGALRPTAGFWAMLSASVFVVGHGLLHVAEGWLGLGDHVMHAEEAVGTLGQTAVAAGLTWWLRPAGGAR